MSYHKRGSPGYELRSSTAFPSTSVKGLHGTGRSKGYGRDKYPGIKLLGEESHKSDKQRAQIAFDARSERSKSQDLVQLAEITPDLQAWLRSPNRLDFQGVDTPNARLIFTHKSRQAQAADLARAAKRKVPLEIWIKDTAHADLLGVDTKTAKHGSTEKPHRIVRKFKIEKKGMVPRKLKRPEGRKLPTTEEIVKKATETFKEEQAKKGLPSITPEVSELKEAGLITKARDDLMRTEAKVSSQIEQYVHELNEQLEPEGYTIVPI